MWIKEFVFDQKCIPWSIIALWTNSKVRVKLMQLRSLLVNTNTKKYWDKTWTRELKNLSINRFYPRMYFMITSIVPEGSRVLDLGCGIGILMEKLKNEKKCSVFGIDISKTAVSSVLSKGMVGVVAKVPPISLPSEGFDIVVATEVLEHLRKPELLIKEILRVLKKGGIYILSVPEHAGPEVNKEHLRAYTENAIEELLFSETKDFKLIKVKEDFESHNLIIAYGKKVSVPNKKL